MFCVPVTRRRASARVALVAALVSVSLPAIATPPSRAAATASATAAPADARATTTRLSNLHTLSRWAYPTYPAPVRSRPSARGRRIGTLRLLTGDGQAALYVALDSEQLASGATWVHVELPGRPNGGTGWVEREALGTMHVIDGYLRVDEQSLRATLFRDGRPVFSAPVGVGKPSTVTPAGHFYVMEKLRTFDAPLYGPYALGTSAYAPTLSEWPGGGVVGIHGTDEPQLIPGRPSHGCVRMRNADITRLWFMISVGTPIEIT
jgi:hypothetical protein